VQEEAGGQESQVHGDRSGHSPPQGPVDEDDQDVAEDRVPEAPELSEGPRAEGHEEEVPQEANGMTRVSEPVGDEPMEPRRPAGPPRSHSWSFFFGRLITVSS
jgi:hypothetical protein